MDNNNNNNTIFTESESDVVDEFNNNSNINNTFTSEQIYALLEQGIKEFGATKESVEKIQSKYLHWLTFSQVQQKLFYYKNHHQYKKGRNGQNLLTTTITMNINKPTDIETYDLLEQGIKEFGTNRDSGRKIQEKYLPQLTIPQVQRRLFYYKHDYQHRKGRNGQNLLTTDDNNNNDKLKNKEMYDILEQAIKEFGTTRGRIKKIQAKYLPQLTLSQVQHRVFYYEHDRQHRKRRNSKSLITNNNVAINNNNDNILTYDVFWREHGKYNVQKLWELSNDLPIQNVSMNFLEFNLDNDYWTIYVQDEKQFITPNQVLQNPSISHIEYDKIIKADLSRPILVYELDNDVLDGLHRLSQLKMNNIDTVQVRYISTDLLNQAKITIVDDNDETLSNSILPDNNISEEPLTNLILPADNIISEETLPNLTIPTEDNNILEETLPNLTISENNNNMLDETYNNMFTDNNNNIEHVTLPKNIEKILQNQFSQQLHTLLLNYSFIHSKSTDNKNRSRYKTNIINKRNMLLQSEELIDQLINQGLTYLNNKEALEWQNGDFKNRLKKRDKRMWEDEQNILNSYLLKPSKLSIYNTNNLKRIKSFIKINNDNDNDNNNNDNNNNDNNDNDNNNNDNNDNDDHDDNDDNDNNDNNYPSFTKVFPNRHLNYINTAFTNSELALLADGLFKLQQPNIIFETSINKNLIQFLSPSDDILHEIQQRFVPGKTIDEIKKEMSKRSSKIDNFILQSIKNYLYKHPHIPNKPEYFSKEDRELLLHGLTEFEGQKHKYKHIQQKYFQQYTTKQLANAARVYTSRIAGTNTKRKFNNDNDVNDNNNNDNDNYDDNNNNNKRNKLDFDLDQFLTMDASHLYESDILNIADDIELTMLPSLNDNGDDNINMFHFNNSSKGDSDDVYNKYLIKVFQSKFQNHPCKNLLWWIYLYSKYTDDTIKQKQIKQCIIIFMKSNKPDFELDYRTLNAWILYYNST